MLDCTSSQSPRWHWAWWRSSAGFSLILFNIVLLVFAAFAVKSKNENLPPPVQHNQIFPGDATKLYVGSEAYGVFVAGELRVSLFSLLSVLPLSTDLKNLIGWIYRCQNRNRHDLGHRDSSS
jgi:hypothetical protein